MFRGLVHACVGGAAPSQPISSAHLGCLYPPTVAVNGFPGSQDVPYPTTAPGGFGRTGPLPAALACAAASHACTGSGVIPAVPSCCGMLSVLPCAALCCPVLPCAALSCPVLLCAALCCAVLRCAALCRVCGGPHWLLWSLWQPPQRHPVRVQAGLPDRGRDGCALLCGEEDRRMG